LPQKRAASCPFIRKNEISSFHFIFFKVMIKIFFSQMAEPNNSEYHEKWEIIFENKSELKKDL
jgi:hypothetical protein